MPLLPACSPGFRQVVACCPLPAGSASPMLRRIGVPTDWFPPFAQRHSGIIRQRIVAHDMQVGRRRPVLLLLSVRRPAKMGGALPDAGCDPGGIGLAVGSVVWPLRGDSSFTAAPTNEAQVW